MRAAIGWILLISWSGGVDPARILAVLPFPGRSHHIFSTAIMKALAQRGHQIVEYSPYPPSNFIPNHTYVEIHNSFEKELSGWNYESFIYQTTHMDKSLFGCKLRRIWEMNYQVCEDTFNHPNIQKLLKSNENFDLVMSESTFGQESLLAIGHKFSAPTITIETFFPFSILNRIAGNSLEIASIPDLSSKVVQSYPMTFTDRVLNFISVSLTLLQHYYIHVPLHDEIVKNYFDGNVPPVADMVSNVSLYLVNSYPTAISYIRPHTPNIIPLGGITISSDRATLPEDVLKFMDEAKEGVIFFSFGSVVPIHVMPKEIIQIFLKVFKKLPQRVIWKIPNLDPSIHLTKNIMIKKWAPQLGILAHRNCKVFITHGGLMSTHEALHSGVPTVGIPFFADQPYNVRFMEHREVGIMVDFHSLSEEALTNALTKVLSDPKYKENAVKLSQVYQDRPMSAAESVVFWVDYVLRHRGAPHLRPVSVDMPLYQLYLLDILTIITTFIIFSGFIFYLCLRRVFKFSSA